MLERASRVVIKIGSSLLVDEQAGGLREQWLAGLVADVAALRTDGVEVLIVSSGAIAMGRRGLGLPTGVLRLDESQAAAASGQIRLAHAWQRAFELVDLRVAQLLLTLNDTESRGRYLNARRTVETLLKLGAVPIVNENDTVATEEIRYGDNDRLAARVAQMVGAQRLILLSDVDGLYSADPERDAGARHVPVVDDITEETDAMAGDASSSVGTGGMRTKVLAARIAVAAGCEVLVADGRVHRPLQALRDGARHTRFAASGTPASARKQWIAGSLSRRGTLSIDDGAATALRAGKSLLAAGVTEVNGQFERGDAVSVITSAGVIVAVGLCAYAARDSHKIRGQRGERIATLLGYSGRPELIHRNDLVLLTDPEE
ncbi:MAG: glutamate 5-kinase [Gammaproteobacteria bacterium]